MEELLELTVEQLARTLDISKDAAGFLLLVLVIFLFAWTVSWLFLPWTIYSKLNNITERLSSISVKLTTISDKVHQVRDDAQSCAVGVNRLNEKVQEFNKLGSDLSERKV